MRCAERMKVHRLGRPGMLFVGTSSYSFKEWVGPFYPPKTPPSRHLACYSSRLRSVRINHTYRRFPTEKLSASWAAATPESFALSLKVHRSISHFKRLENLEEPLRDFLRNLEPLGPRVGVTLIQLPPAFEADLRVSKKFWPASRPAGDLPSSSGTRRGTPRR